MVIKRNLAFGIIFLAFLAAVGLIYWQSSKFPKIPEVKVKEKIPKPEKIPSKVSLASGKQVYEIITDRPRDPQIIEIEVDPLDVEIGKTQVVTVKVKTKADSVRAEDYVLGTAILDGNKIDFPLKLKKAEGKEELITTWQGEWERKFPIEKHYQIRIFVKNIKGEDSVTLSFGSECQNVPPGGTYIVNTNCTFAGLVNGVEKNADETCGDLIISSGYTLTINNVQTPSGLVGQTIVWNPGCKVVIDGYIAIAKGYGAQLRKTYIWAKDEDGDSYYTYLAQDSQPTGYVRRRTLSSLTPQDCDDGNGNIFQIISGVSLDNDQDGYTATNPATQCVGTSSVINNRTYYKDSSGAYSWLVDSQKLGTGDCLDSGTGAQYVYQTINNLVIDADHDSYQGGSIIYSSVCVGTSTTIAGRTYYMSTSSQYIWLPYSLANGSIDVDDSNDCIDIVTHECCDATNPTDGNRPAKTAQCLTSCKKCNGTSIDSINVTAGYVCTGSGTESLPSTSVYCATAAANLNACQYVTYYRSCDGSGSCRTDNTGAYSTTTTCGPGYATLNRTSCTSVTTGNYCTASSTCVDLDNDGETETRRTNYYGCAGSGSTCETTIRAYTDYNCCTSAGKYCSSGSCTGSLCPL
jgi:hypothetical protein